MPTDPQHLLAPGAPRKNPGDSHGVRIGIGGFILGVLAVFLWIVATKPPAPARPPSEAAGAESASVVQNPAGLVSVHDQPAGSSVTVDSVSVPAPGVWVAVEELEGDDLGNVLGAARALGPATNLSVHLLRATVPAQTYAVVLYRDNGDGVFDQHSDSLYVDWNTGERVVILFRTTL